MNTVVLAKKTFTIEEPVFKQLRRIIRAYNSLAVCADAEKKQHIYSILHALLGDQLPYFWQYRISETELHALLLGLPQLIGLDSKAPTKTHTRNTNDDDWGSVYAHLAASFAWDYDAIDNTMTLSKLRQMSNYLEKHPPTHLLAAAWVGYKKEDTGMDAWARKVINQVKAAKS